MTKYINIHVNSHLFLDAKHAGRISHIKLKELESAPSAGKAFQFTTKQGALNFINALVTFAADYPSVVSDPSSNGHKWIYHLGNASGFKIDFPAHR